MSDLKVVREICEGCGSDGTGMEFRTGDESTGTARWSSPPMGWLTALDAGGEHWVCSVACARKVDTANRARKVLEEGVGPRRGA